MARAARTEEACRECALRLLAQRAHAVAELRRKLVARGFGATVVQALLRDFERTGLLDDSQFAALFIEERMRGSGAMGHARLRSELRRRGVDPEVARAAIDQLRGDGDDEDTEFASALELGRKKWRLLAMRKPFDPLRAGNALLRFLAGRGFSGDTCRRVLDAVNRAAEEP
ncbi:MAG: regulatory protein RecX [Lentisphaeria bacterium]|nr:regulatory protein RecX [Lentisphaeria bacterium]